MTAYNSNQYSLRCILIHTSYLHLNVCRSFRTHICSFVVELMRLVCMFVVCVFVCMMPECQGSYATWRVKQTNNLFHQTPPKQQDVNRSIYREAAREHSHRASLETLTVWRRCEEEVAKASGGRLEEDI